MKEQILRAKQIPRSETLQKYNPDKDKSNTPVPFTITYNPALPNIQEILHRKQPILNSTDRLQKYSKINHLSLTVVHQTFATFWFEQN